MKERVERSRTPQPHKDKDTKSTSQVSDRFQVYSDYNKLLRSWLVAYGVGGPILLATNDTLNKAFIHYKYSNYIVWLYLIGVLFQVGVAFINKWAAWQMYSGEYEVEHQNSNLYKFWDCVNDQSWIDFCADFISCGVFVAATLWTLVVINIAK